VKRFQRATNLTNNTNEAFGLKKASERAPPPTTLQCSSRS